MHDFSFDGVNLSSFAGRILQAPVHTVASRNITRVKIYGQSGDEIIDNGSYNNVDFSLKIGFLPYLTQQTVNDLVHAVIDWLAPLQSGYFEYRDTLNPDYFTRACLINFEEIRRELRTFFTATLKFTRVPFWYSDIGAQPVTQSESGYVDLRNPEKYESEPVVRLEYTGTAANNNNCTLNIGGNYYSLTAGGFTKIQVLDGVAKQHYKLENGQKEYLSNNLPPDLLPNRYYGCYAQLGIYQTKGKDLMLSITPNWRRL